MYSTVMASMLDGISAIPVRVEVDISAGMPGFEMVGSLSPEVREARERVRTALGSSGIVLPSKHITVNLSPANIKKRGTGFDLPIAVALLVAMGKIPQSSVDGTVFAGELNLRGELLAINGVLPIVSDGVAAGAARFAVPADNVHEARLVRGEGIYGFETLEDVIAFLDDGYYVEPEIFATDGGRREQSVDFSEVNGQRFLRRVAEIAASGMHNMLMVGPPGAGKTMISERMATILPAMSEEERLELSKIYSVCGLLSRGGSLPKDRPFRSPHHTVTRIALTGGGISMKPGEISLAHNGVLFLDELTEFDRPTVETLRQPLEEKQINISRASGSVTYPCDFLLLAAMNPCACGYYPDMQRCRCTPAMLQRYTSRVSKPLLDRIDICVEAPAVSYDELTGSGDNESSETIRARVQECHERQRQRFRDEGFTHNSQIPAARIGQFCPLGDKEQRYMEKMYDKLGLTARTYHKVLRVARTIADADGSDEIRLSHLTEAACYRSIGEKFWGGA